MIGAGDIPSVEKILRADFSVDDVDPEQSSILSEVLIAAAQSGEVKLCSMLLKRGADVNHRDQVNQASVYALK